MKQRPQLELELRSQGTNSSSCRSGKAVKQILFFATPADIVPVLRQLESKAPLKFVEIGTLSTPNRAIYLDSSQIPDPGIATHETGSQSRAYMVSNRNTKNRIRSSTTNEGETRWNLFGVDNEDSVSLNMAGVWKTGTLLPGNVSTLHETPEAQQLMRWFRSALKQEGFTKVERWWLGKEALKMLRGGRRLTTTAEQSPPQFDLRLPDDLRRS